MLYNMINDVSNGIEYSLEQYTNNSLVYSYTTAQMANIWTLGRT